jgi:DNA-binding CsgD family transcriptional regulator
MGAMPNPSTHDSLRHYADRRIFGSVDALPERDVRRFVEFAHETARVARAEPRRLYSWAIAEVGRLVPSDAVWHIESNRGVLTTSEASLVRVRANDPRFEAYRNRSDVIAAWNERLAYEHPTAVFRLQRPFDFRPLRLSDFMTLTPLRQLEAYDVLLRPFGFTRTVNVGYRGSRGLNEVVCARTRLDFTDRELMLLELAATAIGLAVRDPAPVVPSELALTAKEAEVLDRVARGCSNAEIAQALSVAPGTIKKHLDNIYAKLGVRNRVQAARAWLDATRD